MGRGWEAKNPECRESLYLACQELKSILWWRQDQNTLTVSHHYHHYWHLLFGKNWQHKSTKQQQKVFSFDLVNLSLRNLSYLPMKYYVLLCMKLTTNPEPWREGFSANWPASLVSMVAFNAHNNPTWTCFTNSILRENGKWQTRKLIQMIHSVLSACIPTLSTCTRDWGTWRPALYPHHQHKTSTLVQPAAGSRWGDGFPSTQIPRTDQEYLLKKLDLL